MADTLTDALAQLSTEDLIVLGTALRTGRLAAPYSEAALGRVLGAASGEVARTMQALVSQGFSSTHLVVLCETVAAAKAPKSAVEDLIELVTTGPETPAVTSRDTAVVVRDLFVEAVSSVILAGYAVYRGHVVFQALAQRMTEVPTLQARLLLDIRREYGEDTAGDILVKRFVTTFKRQNWPKGARVPDVYYDPRSLELTPERRAALHAKCVVVDGAKAFVSSANFTEAAQEKNIEVGLLVKSPALASKLATHFNALISAGLLKRAC